MDHKEKASTVLFAAPTQLVRINGQDQGWIVQRGMNCREPSSLADRKTNGRTQKQKSIAEREGLFDKHQLNGKKPFWSVGWLVGCLHMDHFITSPVVWVSSPHGSDLRRDLWTNLKTQQQEKRAPLRLTPRVRTFHRHSPTHTHTRISLTTVTKVRHSGWATHVTVTTVSSVEEEKKNKACGCMCCRRCSPCHPIYPPSTTSTREVPPPVTASSPASLHCLIASHCHLRPAKAMPFAGTQRNRHFFFKAHPWHDWMRMSCEMGKGRGSGGCEEDGDGYSSVSHWTCGEWKRFQTRARWGRG